MAQSSITPTRTRKSHHRPQAQRNLHRVGWLRRLSPLLTPLLLLALWQLLAWLEIYPRFLIPAPLEVWESFVEVAGSGTLWKHTRVTMSEMLIGLGIGASIGMLLGYLIEKNPLLEELLSPIIVAMQSTPIVAYAPLLIIWFGSGPISKILTSAMIVFFPTLMNTVVGLRNVPQNLRDLMRSLNATRLQTFLRLEMPAALPVLLTGLKTSATLAVIGAVVGEFVSAGAGLGFLVSLARNQFNTPLVLVAVFMMTALALSLYLLITLLEWYLLAWQRRSTR